MCLATKRWVICTYDQCTLNGYLPNPQGHDACYTPVLKEYGPQGHGLVCIQVHLQGSDSLTKSKHVSSVLHTSKLTINLSKEKFTCHGLQGKCQDIDYDSICMMVHGHLNNNKKEGCC